MLRTASQFFNELQAKYQRLGTKRSSTTSFPGLPRLQQAIERWTQGRPENKVDPGNKVDPENEEDPGKAGE